MARKPHILAGLVRVNVFADTLCGAEPGILVGYFEPYAVEAITDGLDAIGLMLAAHPEHEMTDIWVSTVEIGARGQPLMRTHDVPQGWSLEPSHSAAPAWSHATQGNA